MKIGILSDTHTKVKEAKDSLELLLTQGSEFIIHAGDVVELEVLELLKNCGKKYVCVYGNNDRHLMQYHDIYNLVQEPYYFKIANTKFKLMHMPLYMAPDAEVVIFGHTHIFHAEFINSTLFLNPGESCAREKPVTECAILEIKDHLFIVTHYYKNTKEELFHTDSFTYKRTQK